MPWSGSNMKTREGGRQHVRRQRYNSSSSNSTRSTPSPKLYDESRTSPIQSCDFQSRTGMSVRFSPRPSDCTSSGLSRSPSPQGSAYAGAKFSDPPSPELLPKPPTHWMNFDPNTRPSGPNEMASQLKLLLNVVQQA